jgi:hypothetical protein
MKKSFLKCTIALSVLATACAVNAATNDNPNNSAGGIAGGIGSAINQGVNNTLGNIGGTVGNTVNTGLASGKTALKNQGVNFQDATNSLIKWLNANFVNGIPPGFSKSIKGNFQNILANYSLSDLNWLLTQNFTLALLAGIDASEVGGDDTTVPTAPSNDNVLKGMKSALSVYKYDTVRPELKNSPPAVYLESQVARFNIGSLLSTTTIEPNSAAEKNAHILLQFVSGLNGSVSGLPTKIADKGLGPVDEFQSQFGTYLAQQSVGLNALYNLLNERLVKKGLGSQLGTQLGGSQGSQSSQSSQADMSPLGLDQYMATRRLDNTNSGDGNNTWMSQLSTATPAQMSKEQLIISSEILYETYLMRQSLEQITTLLAVQQLQASNANAEKLQQLKNEIMSANTSKALGN